ncbi:RNA 2',3'-cyclic phosphodiesterase [Frankia sp. Cas3]|uniref:RNA 2',3'-cyclic phosphodiesterase n=1 Tax=Frankia sp. Cas3 TaxID=3073926 RepID=UPI002AD5142D|nr:RNA 2',3'-cyclic phosphodiesterase [Frankia sp. Cas3]
MARLFVALVPPTDVVDPLLAAVRRLRTDHRQLAAEVRWAPPETWHITLAFLGKVPAAVLPDLTERLADVARRHPPASVTIAGGGRFGSRVLFADVDEAPLAPLAAAVAREAKLAGVVGLDDTRAWRGHLTLATVARSHPGRRQGISRSAQPPDAPGPDLRPMVAALADVSCRSWTAEMLILLRSGPDPAKRYETAASWPLSGRPGARSRC